MGKRGEYVAMWMRFGSNGKCQKCKSTMKASFGNRDVLCLNCRNKQRRLNPSAKK